ncbi:MAG: GNAT family N-acetyltransferase [Saprospiraceae bacterium]|nr:GNAT family N-acetyltransferase [Saprospiraceae bacterium]MDZ4705729.1 GNAT family N-acetyltransferase [Saprospiraceae bacterium]
MIEIKLLDKKGLAEYLYSDAYIQSPVIPITRHRALSQIRNPQAEAEDVLLLLAYEGSTLVGYLGVLPDRMNGTLKCGWMSCLWIAPEHRGKQIAQQLLQHCFEAWGQKLLATEFTAPAKKLYDKTGLFRDLPVKRGLRLYLRSDLHTLLTPRSPWFEKIGFFLKAFDGVANAILDARFLIWKPGLGDLKLEYVREVDEEAATFIEHTRSAKGFQKGAAELNWVFQNPWVLSAPEKDDFGKRYHFSSTDQSFDFYGIKIKNQKNQLLAFLVFSKRNRFLKLPFCYVEREIDAVLQVVAFHLHRWRVNVFTVFHPALVERLRQRKSLFFLKREVRRHYLISKVFELENCGENFEIQDGDGDCGFT